MTRRILKFIALPLLIAGVFLPHAAYACTSPTGVKGEFFYNDDFNVMQYCDGTDWIAMSGGTSGGGAGVTDGDKGDISVSGSGASWMLDDDVLDFSEFKDLLTLDATTDIAISGSMVFSLTNTGTGNSFVVNDQATDSTPFVVDAAGNVGIGVAAPTQALDVDGKVTANAMIVKAMAGLAAPTGGSGGSGGGSGIQVMTTTARNAISSPATGMVIYNTTTAQLEVYSGSAWVGVGSGTAVTVHAHQTSVQSIPGGGAVTKINMHAEYFDTTNAFDLTTDRFTPQVPGKYLVTVQGGVAGMAAGVGVEASIYKNGSVYAWGTYVTNGGASASAYSVATTIVDMNGSTDYLEPYIYNGDSTRNSAGSRETTYFTATLLNGGSGSGGGGGSSASGSAGYLQVSDGSGAFASSSASAGQQLFWDTTNHRLGIGTDSPTSRLQIQPSSPGVLNAISINNDVGNERVRVSYDTTNVKLGIAVGGTVTTPQFTIDGSGNVGIGTASPSYTLDVVGSAALRGASSQLRLIETDNADPNDSWHLSMNSASLAFVHADASAGPAYTFAMYLLPSGNVGIGTGSPSSKLDVNGTIQFGGNKGYLGYYNVNPYDQAEFGAVGASTSLSLVTNSQSRLNITPAGDVGIGTVGPGAKLHIRDGEIMASVSDSIASGSYSHGWARAFLSRYGYIWSTIPSTSTEANMYLHRHTNGYLIRMGYGGSDVGSISTSGASVSFNTTSDYRLKENVVPIANALTRVEQLRPSQFDFKDDAEHSTIEGFVAHEVQMVAPYAVTGTKDAVDGDGKPLYQQVDYGKLTPLLAAAIKELKADNDNLRAALEAQGREIEALKAAR